MAENKYIIGHDTRVPYQEILDIHRRIVSGIEEVDVRKIKSRFRSISSEFSSSEFSTDVTLPILSKSGNTLIIWSSTIFNDGECCGGNFVIYQRKKSKWVRVAGFGGYLV